MARQVEEGGWPLGLQPMNLRAVSFSTMVSGSPSSSSYSSSDLDTESTGSFFHDRSVTLGNLMGVSSIVELSRRSLRRGKINNDDVVDVSTNNIVPLGHFLEVERRAAQDNRQGQHSPLVYGADELTLAQPFRESSNSLFVDGHIMPPTRSSPWSGLDDNDRRKSRGFITPCF
ncbi:hypothetical protein M8C21_031361 [Ambrosia artemisiifolia]|uniref:Uncharacterized protein n=1 Tax=Ambrosia artemisiifolia TaxID=4212 RepID=A0AAD5BZ16_AMBAR|nr:hypothetical protein M8C21_031361 [Ambrosia artemisiifolia]